MSIRIDPELQLLIPPLSPEEFEQLEANILKDGIRDPLVVWPQDDGSEILIDGHNRWKIAAMHGGIPFNTVKMDFGVRDAVKLWILRNQLGRRNVDKWVKFDLVKQLEELEKGAARQRMSDGAKGVPTLAQADIGKTRDKMAKLVGVSHGTYDKMKVIDERATPKTKQLVREGKLSINQAYIAAHEHREDPVKKAKQEHEEFQAKKAESVVSIQDAQIDKINQEIISNGLYQDFLRVLNTVDKFGMTYSPGALNDLRKMIKDDERKLFVERCEMCMAIMQKITDNIRRYM